jgi:hypothetical protein
MIPDSSKRQLNTSLKVASIRFTVTSRHGRVFNSERPKANSRFKEEWSMIYTKKEQGCRMTIVNNVIHNDYEGRPKVVMI